MIDPIRAGRVDVSRRRIDRADGDDTRQHRYVAEQPRKERLGELPVLRCGFHRQYVLGPETERHVLESKQAPDEQPSSRKEDDGTWTPHGRTGAITATDGRIGTATMLRHPLTCATS